MLALKIKMFTFLLALQNLVCGCSTDNKNHDLAKHTHYLIHKIARLPDVIGESSGLAMMTDSTFVTHNDDTDTVLYEVNLNGKLVKQWPIPNSKNKDWEDLAAGKNGLIYIGDFGNNLNKRKDLRIYIFDTHRPQSSQIINFCYPDQSNFPQIGDFNFDCEAFFYHQDSLYVFSKNRSGHKVKMYVLPASPGNFTARLSGTCKLDKEITAADISPDGKTFALLAYSKVYLFAVNDNKIRFDKPTLCVNFAKSGQCEGLAFINNTDFIISNEGGKLFLATRKHKK